MIELWLNMLGFRLVREMRVTPLGSHTLRFDHWTGWSYKL